MDTIEMLNTFRRATTEIEELERQVEHVMPSGRPAGVRGASGRDGGPSTNNGMAAAMQLADGLSELIRRKRDTLDALRPDIARVMDAISDGREYQIVQRYYLMGETDESIGLAMGLSRVRVGQIRKRVVARTASENS